MLCCGIARGGARWLPVFRRNSKDRTDKRALHVGGVTALTIVQSYPARVSRHVRFPVLVLVVLVGGGGDGDGGDGGQRGG